MNSKSITQASDTISRATETETKTKAKVKAKAKATAKTKAKVRAKAKATAKTKAKATAKTKSKVRAKTKAKTKAKVRAKAKVRTKAKVRAKAKASTKAKSKTSTQALSHTKPHDAFFKLVFSQPEHARGPLKQILPASVAKQLNWSTLTRLPAEHTNVMLEASYSDLVFSVKAHARGLAVPRELLLMFAWEHQSWVEAMMALRFYLYTGQIWKTYVERLDAPKHYLPELVPVVLYQGKTWTAPRSLTDLHTLDGQPRLLPEPMIDLKYIAYELDRDQIPKVPIEQPGYTVMAWGALSIMTVIRGKNPMRYAAFVARVIDEVTIAYGTAAGKTFLRYVQSVRTDNDLEIVMEHMNEDIEYYTPESGLGQAYIRGEARGEAKGRAEFLLMQLRTRFNKRLSKAVQSRVKSATAKQLELWGKRVLTANTLDDVFDR